MHTLIRRVVALSVGSLAASLLLWSGPAAADDTAPMVLSTPVGAQVTTPTPETSTALPPDVAPVTGARALTATPSVIPGQGKRVWFSIAAQQVWLVNADNTVAHTYLVSGSRFGQLRPGTYSVFSRSSATRAWNSNARMKYMVRFARGKNAAIGFHSIPRYPNGRFAQTERQLGLPLSDGCVRQSLTDAKALWDFAPVGTSVIVTK